MKLTLSLGTAQALLATAGQVTSALGAPVLSNQLAVYTDLKHHSMRIAGNEYIVEVDDDLVLRIAHIYLRLACFVAKVIAQTKSFFASMSDDAEDLAAMIDEPK